MNSIIEEEKNHHGPPTYEINEAYEINYDVLLPGEPGFDSLPALGARIASATVSARSLSYCFVQHLSETFHIAFFTFHHKATTIQLIQSGTIDDTLPHIELLVIDTSTSCCEDGLPTPCWRKNWGRRCSKFVGIQQGPERETEEIST